MKKIFVFMLVIMSSLAFGQNVDDLKDMAGKVISSAQAKGEKSKLSKAGEKYNEEQPDVRLAGQTVEVRPPRDQWSSWNDQQRRWMRSALEASLTTLAARPVWNTSEIEEESQERDSLEANRWVNKKSLPDKGTIEIAAFTLEFEFLELEKSKDMEIFWGRGWWGGGNNLRLSRETAYCGLTVTIRDRHTGGVSPVYKTLGIASSADNVSAQLGGFFSSRFGFSSDGNSEDDRRFRAMENSLREMGAVIKQKCQ